ncbi:hypothetical protein [Nocardia arizonensis]|uniref:hypothetical protein n=1 Tax=Nocardia arizonensis TaxID=1141647 RepID=UPI0006D14DF2|nr:hypothetical protein [Nocardia arizonensis]
MIRRPAPDIRFATRVLATIADLPNHPRHPGLSWDQGIYRRVEVHEIVHADTGAPVCATALCFAGWVVELDPEVDWAYDTMTLRTRHLAEDTVNPPVRLDWDLTTAVDLATGHRLYAHEYARRRLGLSDIQAETLFSSTNTLDDLAEIIARISGGRL